MTSEQINIQYYKSPVGEIILGSFNGKLCLADWRYRRMRTTIDSRIKKYFDAEYIEESSEVIENTISQFEEYFDGKREEFNIPIAFAGSDFQKSVWEELMKVPYGKTDTYLGLSKKLKNEKAIRAVASANGANAIAIIIPCHRIIGSKGELVGYAGGLNVKKRLLQLESQNQNTEQLELF
ncbi:MAG: methylated-DNA--[protein]-cysteine S-methyltransferase [Bacteroidota bacterium]